VRSLYLTLLPVISALFRIPILGYVLRILVGIVKLPHFNFDLRRLDQETHRIRGRLANCEGLIAQMHVRRGPEGKPDPVLDSGDPIVPPALSASHIANDARLFASRQDLLLALAVARGCVVAEVGVALGDFSAFLIESLAPERFVAFDTFDMHEAPSHWGMPSSVLFQGLTHYDFYQRRFAWLGDKIQMERGDSRQTLAQYDDGFFDVIYVDAGHTYDHVKHDAIIALKKLRADGVLIFNDYVMYDPYLKVNYGVVQAVNELVVEHELRVIGFGLQQAMFCDIAVCRR
jgi:hypothetical protein